MYSMYGIMSEKINKLCRKVLYCWEVSIPSGKFYWREYLLIPFRLPFLFWKVILQRSFSSEKIILHNIRKRKLHENKPRVLHIISNIEIGGSQKIVFDIANGIPEFVADILDLSTKKYFDGQARKFIDFRSAEDAMRLINHIRPSIGHIHYYGDYFHMHAYLDVFLRSVTQVKWIENANNPIPIYPHRNINQFVYVSNYCRSIQRKKYLRNTDTVVYPGVDMRQYKKKTQINEKMVKNIGFVYRLGEDKIGRNTIELIIKIIKQGGSNFQAHIVGNGVNFFHYIKRVNEEQIRNQIKFYGSVNYSDLPMVYDSFDVFIAPVHTESYGVVVPYAMAKGIPVVANNIGALPEILGSCGYLCDTEKEFIERVIWIANNTSEYDRMRQVSHERIKRKFSLDVMLRSYLKIYRSL